MNCLIYLRLTYTSKEVYWQWDNTNNFDTFRIFSGSVSGLSALDCRQHCERRTLPYHRYPIYVRYVDLVGCLVCDVNVSPPPLNFILAENWNRLLPFTNRQKSLQSFFYLLYLAIFREQTIYPMADRDTDELNIDNVIKKLLKGNCWYFTK